MDLQLTLIKPLNDECKRWLIHNLINVHWNRGSISLLSQSAELVMNDMEDVGLAEEFDYVILKKGE